LRLASKKLFKIFLSSSSLFILLGCSENSKDNAKVEEKVSPPQQEKPKEVKQIPVHEKKKNFRDLVIPAVEKVYAELDAQYKEVKELVDSNTSDPKIDLLMKKYSAEDHEQLLRRLKPHPKSIAVAQAAMESAWATSRFTKVANNLFGVWSFDKDEPRVAASETRGSKTIYVKKYDSVYESVKDYYMVLSKGFAYEEFRKLNMKTQNPYELVKKLERYSEKGAKYGNELASMIRFNKFYKLDGFKEGELKYTTVVIEKTADINATDLNNTVLKKVDINNTSIKSVELNSTDLNTTDINNSN
jgi:Bax protein